MSGRPIVHAGQRNSTYTFGRTGDRYEKTITIKIECPALRAKSRLDPFGISAFQELRRQASWYGESVAFFHYRDKDGAEVDIVIERGARALAGIEIKASATVTGADFRGLRKLKEASDKRFVAGLILYDGEACASFGDGMYAVPLRALWETT